MNKAFLWNVGLVALCMQGAFAEEAAPSSKSSSRSYSGSVQMHEMAIAASPVATELPPPTAPESSHLDRTHIQAEEMLMNLYPPSRTRPSKRGRSESNWLPPSLLNVKTEGDLAQEAERRESGWGWLADDISERREAAAEIQDEAEVEVDGSQTDRDGSGPFSLLMKQSHDKRLASRVFKEVGINDAQDAARVDDREQYLDGSLTGPPSEQGLLRTKVSALEDAGGRDAGPGMAEREPVMPWRSREKDEPSLMPRTSAMLSQTASAEREPTISVDSRAPDPSSMPGPFLNPSDSDPADQFVLRFGGRGQVKSSSPSDMTMPRLGSSSAASVDRPGSPYSATTVAPPTFRSLSSPAFSSSSGLQAGQAQSLLRPWGSMLPSATPSSSGTGAQY